MLKRVLVIDDEPDVLSSVIDVLSYHRYQCDTAHSAALGFDKIAQFQPHLVILDLEMNEMSGFGFLRELRKKPEYSRLPVVIHSGFCDEDIVREGMSLGANSYLKKNCGVSPLLRTIRNYL